VLALALDSSTLTLACALAEFSADGGVCILAESLHAPPEKAGDALPGALQEVCASAGRTLDDVSAIAVGLGPGSFTGLRVGAAAAKALAYARRWPVAGCSSLHALALGAAARVEPGTLIVATTQARKGELYAAAFRAPQRAPHAPIPAALEVVHGEAVFAAAAFGVWFSTLPGPSAVVGSGARACAAELALLGIDVDARAPAGAPETPPASAVAALCAAALRVAAFDPASLFALGPNYLRPSEAEVALGQGRVGGLSPARQAVGQRSKDRSNGGGGRT
jgi:tRNA threonylcarbamoyladenosine biosynthesis protein TsaB